MFWKLFILMRVRIISKVLFALGIAISSFLLIQCIIAGKVGTFLVTYLIVTPVLYIVYLLGFSKKKWVKSFLGENKKNIESDRKSHDTFNRALIERSEHTPFSYPVFLELAAQLYRMIHKHWGRGTLDEIYEYLDNSPRQKIQDDYEDLKNIRNIRFIDLSVERRRDSSNKMYIDVWIESFYTAESINKEITGTYYESSRWVISVNRASGSAHRGSSLETPCPHCGGPIGIQIVEICPFCGKEIEHLFADWKLHDVSNRKLLLQAPDITLYYYKDREKHYKTANQHHVDLEQKLEAIKKNGRFSNFDENEFKKDVKKIFNSIMRAHSTQDWENVRKYLVPSLFESRSYWGERYKEVDIRRVIGDIHISSASIVDLNWDNYYYLITVRFKASIVDYTESMSRLLLAGKRKPTNFSEYWVFIRRRGSENDENAKWVLAFATSE